MSEIAAVFRRRYRFELVPQEIPPRMRTELADLDDAWKASKAKKDMWTKMALICGVGGLFFIFIASAASSGGMWLLGLLGLGLAALGVKMWLDADKALKALNGRVSQFVEALNQEMDAAHQAKKAFGRFH